MKKASTKQPLKALPRPQWKPQQIAFDIISNKKFDMLIMAFIGLNMVIIYIIKLEWSLNYLIYLSLLAFVHNIAILDF